MGMNIQISLLNPVSADLVGNMAHPTGFITGLSVLPTHRNHGDVLCDMMCWYFAWQCRFYYHAFVYSDPVVVFTIVPVLCSLRHKSRGGSVITHCAMLMSDLCCICCARKHQTNTLTLPGQPLQKPFYFSFVTRWESLQLCTVTTETYDITRIRFYYVNSYVDLKPRKSINQLRSKTWIRNLNFICQNTWCFFLYNKTND